MANLSNGTSSDPPDLNMEMEPAREGDGFHHVGLLQWVLLCQHLGAADKILLASLGSLVRSDHGNRRNVTLKELCGMLSATPVEEGENKKPLSLSGLRKQIKNLSRWGQISTPEGGPVTTSSRADMNLRVIVHLYPRHRCDAYRNVRDALAVARGKDPWFPRVAESPGHKSNQHPAPGYKSDQAGHLSNQPGHKSDLGGHFCNPDTGADLRKRDPSKSSSKTFTKTLSTRGSSSAGESSAGVAAGGRERGLASPSPSSVRASERSEVKSVPGDEPGSVGLSADPVVGAYVRGAREASRRSSAALVERVRAQVSRELSLYPWEPYREFLLRVVPEMGANGWSDLEKHVAACATKDELRILRSVPWCGGCGDPERLSDGSGDHPSRNFGLRMVGPSFDRACGCYPRVRRVAG